MESIFIKTFGCTLNQSDSEAMAGLLSKAGFMLVESPEEADAVIINTCTVKKPTETKVLAYIRSMQEMRKRIVVAGCMPQASPEKLKGYPMIGPEHIEEIVQIVEETLNNNPCVLIAENSCDKLRLPRLSNRPAIGIIPVSRGCLGDCSYCIVKRARGNLRSYPLAEITEACRKAIDAGARELWLTAQDMGCYGKDTGSSLPELIRAINSLSGDFYIRVGMINPEHAKEMLDELVAAFSLPKVFKFLHLPVQSGDDLVLKMMRRRYSVGDFLNIVEGFRKSIPDITIATDIICGFPKETEAQFKSSVELVRKVKPDVLNISRFWKRPKTIAAEMRALPGEETKRRSRALTSLFEWEAFEKSKSWRGWEGQAIVEDKGVNDTWIGRNIYYKPIILKGDLSPGKKVKVKVVQAKPHYLIGEIIG